VLRYLSNRIAFADPALKVNLERLESAWEDYQSCRDRDGIYRYLTPVFELVTLWAHGDIAEIYARRAMCRKARGPVDHVPEPFAAIILCTADPAKVDLSDAEQMVPRIAVCGKVQEAGRIANVVCEAQGRNQQMRRSDMPIASGDMGL
jgi:hypothetical protein